MARTDKSLSLMAGIHLGDNDIPQEAVMITNAAYRGDSSRVDYDLPIRPSSELNSTCEQHSHCMWKVLQGAMRCSIGTSSFTLAWSNLAVGIK